MSSTLNATSNPNISVDEHRWVKQIRRILEQESDDFSDIQVTIFSVPKALRDTNPNAYTPQLVALGPYHFWHPELQEMEKYKISSAKRLQNRNHRVKFNTIVDHFLILEHRIRACYHRYLDINSETLAWMFAIDAAFLLEVISIYATKESKLTQISPRMSHLVDHTRRKSAHNDILRDIIMLENQIPLFILTEMLEFLLPYDIANKTLVNILVGLCKDLSPFKMVDNWERTQPLKCEHLLDFMYRVLVPKLEDIVEINEPIDQESKEERKEWKFLMKVKGYLAQIVSKIMLKMPWVFISNLPGMAVLRAILFPDENHPGNFSNQAHSRTDRENSSPLVEEIMIPSVVELSKSGVTFVPTDGDLLTISFDKQTKKFHLPAIKLDVNSEVLIRNLVAYEASCGSGPVVFARYTELMNGIIDTEDDARLLRERGIIFNYLKSDEEVANLWNGMNKSLRLTRVPYLDELIENVNRYYQGNWKVIVCRVMKTYITHSWQCLAFLAAALILFLLMIQIFCSVLFCSRTAGIKYSMADVTI